MAAMKVSELTGPKLAQWVALALGYKVERDGSELVVYLPQPKDVPHSFSKYGWRPDLKWEHGGPIIQENHIDISAPEEWSDDQRWYAGMYQGKSAHRVSMKNEHRADTPLVAAMRCLVSSKYGDEVPGET